MWPGPAAKQMVAMLARKLDSLTLAQISGVTAVLEDQPHAASEAHQTADAPGG